MVGLDENEQYTIGKNIWNNHWCSELLKVFHDQNFGHSAYPWDISHLRQLFLLCRGPRFTSYQLRLNKQRMILIENVGFHVPPLLLFTTL